MSDKETTFVCSCPGDPSVGIPGSQATVSLYMHPEHDKEDLEFVRAELKAAFTNIFDDKHTQVLTTDEIRAQEEAEEKLFSSFDECERDTLECVSAADIALLRDEEGDTLPPPAPEEQAAGNLSHDALVEAAREGAALGTCDED